MDWAGMLYRMYKRFAERRGFKITIMEEIPADFGIKSVEMRIEGPFAYGYLSGEKGTHRLVRISPFNAQGKRQTSFAGIETWPILEERETENIEIPDKVGACINMSLCVCLYVYMCVWSCVRVFMCDLICVPVCPSLSSCFSILVEVPIKFPSLSLLLFSFIYFDDLNSVHSSLFRYT